MSMQTLPALFIPHGAGPCFFMEWEPADTWTKMGGWLSGLPGQLGVTPKAILVVSAHWEAPMFTVTAHPRPELIYDYGGFPPHTYQLEYPAPGSPELAARVQALLDTADFAAASEQDRGLDHGVFIPLKMIYPAADLPVVQLSLKLGLDPAEHIAAGRALAALREDGVLIVGSGMSYHNMRQFRRDNTGLDPDSVLFDDWLKETVALPAATREQRLIDWAQAPGGRGAHPREEHLLPLHVIVGAAGSDRGQQVLQDQVMGSRQSAYLFGH